MTVFVDTSALYAVFDRDDTNHSSAKEVWTALLREPATLVTTNCVLLETTALLQHRIGMAAVGAFHEDVVPLLQVDFVTAELHRAGVEAVLAAARRKLSLAECVSFQKMRQFGVRTAFCFDPHLSEQGFAMKP